MPFTRSAGLIAGISVASALMVGGCAGTTTPASQVSSNAATLNASVSCDASTTNPCESQFKYWIEGQAGAPTLTAPVQANFDVDDAPIGTTVNGLTPGALYRYQLCGKGDQFTTTTCVGAINEDLSTHTPASKPTNPGQVRSFRTANPAANPPLNATIDEGRLKSSVESAGSALLNRDAGFSVQYQSSPAKSLWVFGDSGLLAPDGTTKAVVMGSTGATGTYTAGSPSVQLDELNIGRGSSGGIHRFLSQPPTTPACSKLLVRWPTGLTLRPGTTKVAVSFGDFCLDDNLTQYRSGIAEYDAATKQFTTAETTPFTASTALDVRFKLETPVYGNDGYLYLYAAKRDFTNGAIYAARVSATASQWGSAANYRWWNGTSWVTSAASAAPIAGTGNVNVGGTEVKDFRQVTSGLYVMLRQRLVDSKFDVLTSTSPLGPWTRRASGNLPDACLGGYVGCYALSPHPELSTSSRFVYTYLSPSDTWGNGHLRVGSLSW